MDVSAEMSVTVAKIIMLSRSKAEQRYYSVTGEHNTFFHSGTDRLNIRADIWVQYVVFCFHLCITSINSVYKSTR